jgi:hypothetical protein
VILVACALVVVVVVVVFGDSPSSMIGASGPSSLVDLDLLLMENSGAE